MRIGWLRKLAKLGLLLWALPWTSVGLFAGLVALATGGRLRRRGSVTEFYGGAIPWFFQRFPGKPSALTLGHAILGRTGAALDAARDHELVHVHQYERWGPFLVPAYLLCSLLLSINRKHAYRDNPFEREAYRKEPENTNQGGVDISR